MGFRDTREGSATSRSCGSAYSIQDFGISVKVT